MSNRRNEEQKKKWNGNKIDGNTLKNSAFDLIDWMVVWCVWRRVVLLQPHDFCTFAWFLAAVWEQQFPIVPIEFDDRLYPIPIVYHSHDHCSPPYSYHLGCNLIYLDHIDMVVSSNFDDGWKIDMVAFSVQMEMCVVDLPMVLTNQQMDAFLDLWRETQKPKNKCVQRQQQFHEKFSMTRRWKKKILNKKRK